jgi:hypothetical protein
MMKLKCDNGHEYDPENKPHHRFLKQGSRCPWIVDKKGDVRCHQQLRTYHSVEPIKMPLADIDPVILEDACRAWHDHGLFPGQDNWDRLVQEGDYRLPGFREKIQAAVTAINLSEEEE